MHEQISIIDFNKLENLSGYLWFSDKDKPNIYENEKTEELTQGRIPFVIEGYLLDKKGEKSYKITNHNGVYKIYQFNLDSIDTKLFRLDNEDNKTPAYKLGNEIKTIRFAKLQKLEPVEELAGFEEWQTVARIFKGFEKY